jgi:hypothetical protein
MTEMADLANILVKSEFKDWLETLPAEHKFTPCDTCDCPLGQYLRDGLGYKKAFVRSLIYVLDSDTFELPTWARKFVHEFDSYNMRVTYPASAALKILNNLEPNE